MPRELWMPWTSATDARRSPESFRPVRSIRARRWVTGYSSAIVSWSELLVRCRNEASDAVAYYPVQNWTDHNRVRWTLYRR